MRRAMVIGFLASAVSLAIPHATPITSAVRGDQQQEKSPPSVSLNPGSLDFGDQVAKSVSKPQRITVTNTGEKPLYVNSVVIDGDNREDFAVVNDTCTGATVAAAKSCVIDVSITPAEIGSRKAAVVITDNAIDSPQRVEMVGNGINSSRVPPSSFR
jgi:hypothetical protein